MPAPDNSVLIGTRSFYEQFAAQFAQMAGTETPWPAWDDLTAEQARSWMLAYAATVEVSARTADAVLSLCLDVP